MRSNINLIRVAQSASGVICSPRVNPTTGLTPTLPPTVGQICHEGCNCANVQGFLFREMNKVYTIIHITTQKILEELDNLPAHCYTEGEVQLILTYLPYECYRKLGNKNSSDDVLTYTDIKETDDTCAKLLFQVVPLSCSVPLTNSKTGPHLSTLVKRR